MKNDQALNVKSKEGKTFYFLWPESISSKAIVLHTPALGISPPYHTCFFLCPPTLQLYKCLKLQGGQEVKVVLCPFKISVPGKGSGS